MKNVPISINVKLLFCGISIVMFFNFTFAQSNSMDTVSSQYIYWVGQFPNIGERQKKDGFKKKLNQIVFGKKTNELIKPISVFANDTNSVWVLDQGAEKIECFQNNEYETPQFLSKKKRNFPSLVGGCAFIANSFLFTDSSLDKIYLFDTDKKKLGVLNDSLVLKQPTGIAYSHLSNEIWVVETGAHRIAILNEKGKVIKTIGKRGNGWGEFNYPTFIWIDNLGNVYIVDSMNFRVQIFDKNGNIISVFGKAGDATGYLARPKGIATDSYGNVYVVDALFHSVQIFDNTGKYLYQFGTQGQGKEQFWMPTGIWIDKNDYIYVADSYNSRIQVFKLDKNRF